MFIIFFILGLIIGSFLNVVVYRLEAVETLMGRSHCPHCRKQIRWHDNIPLVSYFLLSAKCRDCGEKISWQYPAVELATGFVFGLIGKYFFFLQDPSSWTITLFYLAVFSVMMVIFVYDLKYMEIPMLILWIGVAMAVAFVIYSDWTTYSASMGIMASRTFSAVVGGAISFGFFFWLAWYSDETWMGFGDAYLGILAGMIVGWPVIIFTLAFSFTLGALISVLLIAMRKKNMKSQVPFAPFLVAGTFLTLIMPYVFPSFNIVNYYFG